MNAVRRRHHLRDTGEQKDRAGPGTGQIHESCIKHGCEPPDDMDDAGLHDPYTYMRVPAGTLISAEGALSHDERKGNVMSAKIIAVTNQKGGTGKTTTTQNLGDALASKGLEVLLVDMDHQASLSILCGVDQPDQLTDDQIVATPILQVANHETPNTRSIIRHVHEHVDLLASNVMLSRIEMYLSSVSMGRETILKRVLEPVMAEYDVIIIDCAPNLGNLTANDMVAADGLIVPMCAQYLSAKGLDLLLGQYSDARTLNPGLQIIGALITMKDPNRNMQGKVVESLQSQKEQGLPMFDTIIPRGVAAEEASTNAQSVIAYRPDSKVAQAYMRLADEVMAWLEA